MRAVMIRRGDYACEIYDVASFMRLPITSVRKLWQLMFAAKDDNKEAIETIQAWLPEAVAESAERITEAEAELAEKSADKAVKEAQKRVAAAKATHAKTQKLQKIFHEFTNK